jgi:hypothetical protein
MKATVLLLSIIFCSLYSDAVSAGQSGTADVVFSRRFMHKVTPMMPYERLVKIVGTEGTKTGEDKRPSPPSAMYHWNGGRKLALDVRVAEGRIIDATATSPKNKKISLGNNEE